MYEEEAREILAGERAGVLVGIVEEAWDSHVTEGRSRRRRTRANIVSDYMVDLADERLGSLDGVVLTQYQGTPWYIFDDRMALRFKMHNRRLMVSNVGTLLQRRLADQTLTLPGQSPLSYVNCGYQLDRAQADIERVVLTKRLGRTRKPEWVIDLRELATGETGAEPAIRPLQPYDSSDAVGLPSVSQPAEEKEGGS